MRFFGGGGLVTRGGSPRSGIRGLSFVALCVAVVGASGMPAEAVPSLTPDPTAGVEGFRVYAVVQIGPTIYLGGEFSTVGGQPRANLAAIDAASGAVTGWNPGTDNTVFALAAGPDGSLYVGGKFSRVDGQRRSKLARFDADGVLTGWGPEVRAGSVRALAVAGDRAYVGGTFTQIDRVVRNRLAAVHTETAELQDWDPNADAKVHAILVDPVDDAVYVAGFFRNIGGLARRGVAALSASTGRPTAFVSGLGIPAYSLALQPTPGLLFVAGAGAGGTIGALDRSTGAVQWRASGNGDTQAVAASSTTVYLGGHFNTMANQDRLHFAAFDPASGALLGWDPGANGDKGILAAAVVGESSLLIAGDFTVTGGERRDRFARFSGAV